LGPVGVGIVAQLANYQVVLTTVGQLGIPTGTTRLVAQAEHDPELSRGELLTTAYLTVVGCSLVVTAVAVLCGVWLAPLALGDAALAPLATVAALGVVFLALVPLNEAV